MSATKARNIWQVGRIVFLLIIAWAAVRFVTWPDRRFKVEFSQDETHIVAKVVDGDTIELENGDRVRLIGVDTPEFAGAGPEPFAQAAHNFTRGLVEGQTVRLEFDRERFDKYRRVLAFVHLDREEEESVLLNEAIIRAGLGRVMTQFGYSSRKKKRLLQAQEMAQTKGLGLWGRKE